jgi:oligopeptide/dipeptide ABC transporter ATP-binding protein
MRLIPEKQGKITGGKILFENENILDMNDEEMRQVRGGKIGIVFQEAFSSLNPVFTIGDQIKEAIQLHNPDFSNKKSRTKTLEALQRVNIPNFEERYHAFPHQLSGGMQQRAMIAMSLSCNPQILIADEPTTALDVTIQAQILDLLLKVRKEMNMAILLITHNLAVVSQVADRVAIMYAGQIVEMASNEQLFSNPLHPYTVGLLNSVPDVNTQGKKLAQIAGQIPEPENLPKGCPFHPRCPDVMDKCKTLAPETLEWEKGHFVRCFKYSV